MRSLVKIFIGSCMLFFCFSPLWGQYKPLEKPPSQENTYLFKVLRYNRQPKIPSVIKNRISQILQNPKSEWTAQDSLYFAYKNVYLQKFGLALSLFSRLNTDTIQDPHAQTLYKSTLQHLRRYEELKAYNERTMVDDSTKLYSVKDAFMDLTAAYIAYHKDGFISDSIFIFPVLGEKEKLKKLNRNAAPYRNKIVKTAFAIDSAFRQFTFLYDRKDVVLSKAFEEMGDFQKEYLYITNAYFYYAGAFHYNKANKNIIEKYNRSIDEMTAHNYLSISFKHLFGRVLKKRYDLKENKLDEIEKSDSKTPKSIAAPVKKEKRDYLPMLDTPILILIVFAIALIFVLVFVKTKK